MTDFVINSDESLQTTIGAIRDEYHSHRYLRMKLKTGKDRSLSFNDISHVWYQQLARELREYDALGHKCFCKLHMGVPILRAEDAEFRSFYDLAMKHTLSYEQKIAAMKFVPVTSEMTNPQFKRYCDAMQEHFLTKGVSLEFPEKE